jgi:hypothetical protein
MLHGVRRQMFVFSTVSLEVALVRQFVAAGAHDVFGVDEER